MYESTFVEWRRGPLSPTARIPFFSPGDRGGYMTPEYRAARELDKQEDDDKVAQLIAAHRQPAAGPTPQENSAQSSAEPAAASYTPADADPTSTTTEAAEPVPPPGYMFIKTNVAEAMENAVAAIIARFPEAEAILRSFDPALNPAPA